MKKAANLFVKISAVGGVAAVIWAKFKDNPVAFMLDATGNTRPWNYNWDCREPEFMVNPKTKRMAINNQGDNGSDSSTEKYRPTAVRHLFLIRHGQYNLSGKSDPERTLTEMGKIQARHTGERLKELGYPFSIIIQSSMTRAKETANEISGILALPLKTCDMLREGAPCMAIPEHKSWHPQSQVIFQDGARIEAAFRKYFYRADVSQKFDSYEIIVAHANVIRYFVCRALQFPPEGWLRLGLHHGSITWISILPSGKVTMKCFGDSGHFPSNLITSS